MTYQISLPVFEGPFDLLFHLIEKAEVDIYEVSIAEITSQYLEMLQAMQELNLEIASEFLVMAAALLKLKSKKLLPGTEEEDDEPEEDIIRIDSREELIEKLLEYRYFRQAAEELRKYEQAQKRIFVRSLSGEKVVIVNPEDDESIAGVTLPGLLQALQRVMVQNEREPLDMSPEAFSVQDKMRQIMAALRNRPSGTDFFSLVASDASLAEVIAVFIALLELVRLKKITVWQPSPLSRQIFISSLQPEVE